MGTRALIGYLDTNGDLKLTSTYNHYDGYPENLGTGLKNFYNSDTKAEEIANVGYISSLDGETGKWEATHKQKPEVITLTNNFNEAMYEIAQEISNFDGRYGYIWDNENQEWITIKNLGNTRMYKDLTLSLSHLKDKFEISPEQTMEVKDEMSEEELNEAFIHRMKYRAGIIK